MTIQCWNFKHLFLLINCAVFCCLLVVTSCAKPASTAAPLPEVVPQSMELKDRYSKLIMVAPDRGDYTKLSSALNAITDASASNRYVVWVFGRINDDTGITAKSYVDVIGFEADVIVDTSSNVQGVDFNNVVDSSWREITLRRRGTVTQDFISAAQIRGNTDETCRISQCRFLNEISVADIHYVGIIIKDSASPVLSGCVGQGGSGGNYARGISMRDSSSPTLIGCVGQGGSGGIYCSGITTTDAASPILNDCVGKGGSGGSNCNGIEFRGLSSPILVGCVGVSGSGTTDCAAMEARWASSPTLNGCTGLPEKTPSEWVYSSSNNGRFRPYSGKPYQLIGIGVRVLTVASRGTTLSLGTSIGGNEIATSIPLDSKSYKWFDFKWFDFTRVEVAADVYMYATPSAAVADGSFKVYYIVVPNYAGCNGFRMNTSGFAQVSNSTFLANGDSEALWIGADAVNTRNWKISNCHIETFDPTNQRSVNAQNAITRAPIYNCTFIGGFNNIISLDSSDT